jgi:uncharacterized membrane protein
MAKEESRQESEMTSLEAMSYKARQQGRKTLELARRIARETRIAMALAAVAVGLLALAIYMLWRVLEQLPKI